MGDDEVRSVKIDDLITFLGHPDSHGVGEAGAAAPLDAEAKSGALGSILGCEEKGEFAGSFFSDGDHVFRGEDRFGVALIPVFFFLSRAVWSSGSGNANLFDFVTFEFHFDVINGKRGLMAVAKRGWFRVNLRRGLAEVA